jgi:hypothetical protein
MSNCEIPVYPNIKKVINLCKARIQILEIVMFSHVRVAVYLMDSNDIVMESTQFLIENEEYNKWAEDDNYLVKLIKQKIQERYATTI